MRCEIPEVGRCCFCFPLRLGLIVFGYIKLVIDIVLLSFMLIELLADWRNFWIPTSIPFTIIYFIILGSTVADIIFHIIFAVGAHKKDPKKMDLFAKFSIYIFVLYVIGLCISIGVIIIEAFFFFFFFGLMFGAFFFCCLVIQIYIIVLVKSEVKKLERGSNFEFVNHVAEGNMNVKLDLNNEVVQ